jgi:hypothetical protein
MQLPLARSLETGEVCDHFGSYVHSIFLYFCEWLILELEHMTS